MRPFTKLLLLGLFVGFGYAVWPKEPDLRNYDPEKLAALQIRLWKDTHANKKFAIVGTLFQIYYGQYGFNPLSALMIAQSYGRAIILFRGSADMADQERALPHLQEAYTIMRRELGRDPKTMDADFLARTDFTLWFQVQDRGRPEVVAKTLSNYWGALYGIPSGPLFKPAKLYAEQMVEAETVKSTGGKAWLPVYQSMVKSLVELQKITGRKEKK